MMKSSSESLQQPALFLGGHEQDGAQHQDAAFTGEALPEVLLGACPLPVFYKNTHGRYIGCNKAFEDFIGRRRDEIIGKTDFDFNPKHLAELYFAENDALLERGGAQYIERKFTTANGAVRDVAVNKAVLTGENGDPAGLIGAVVDITEHKQAERDLTKALEFAEGIVTAIPDVLFEVDQDGRYLQVWTRSPELLAQQKEMLLGRTVNDVLAPDQAAIAMEALGTAAKEGVAYGRCISISLPNGETRWFELSVAKRPSADPAVNTLLAFSRDITERKRAEEAINSVRTQLLSVLQTMPDMVWVKDMDGVYLLCNHAFERLTGMAESEVVGQTDFELFGTERALYFLESDKAAIQAGGIIVGEEWVISQENGQSVLLETRKVPILGAGGEVAGVLGVSRDVTELNVSRQKIHQMAFYDPLTSLPNRSLFNDRLRQMITSAVSRGQRAGVMLIDIDHFKAVNDTMGHPVGDQLLCQAASRLNESVRDYDTVARLGGDEFAILLPDIREGDDLGRTAGKVLERFKERFLLDGQEVFISCSVGIALYPDDSADANDLVKYADSAMYLAKRSGRNSFRFYSKDLTASAEERMRLESELRRAIERGELELHYQPKVLLDSGAMVGCEALLRWRHPEMGMIPPARFIPVAEDTGLIVELGRWVLREACQTAAEMNAGSQVPHKVAVNLSVKQFQSAGLVRSIAEILEETGCRAEWIEIEITESLLLDQKDYTLQMLSELRNMGFSIAIDDFGTGYSALNYLARFPIDTLKIDRSFINSTDRRNEELVKAILSIARCLGQSVVAEGVETAEQAAFLAANGCGSAQGFLYSKAVPKAEIMALWLGSPANGFDLGEERIRV
ncbi:diguanylate cyclase (GGDEF)-like protein/PAS domain S-box-containing protein [Rhizobium leguminosarum]|uniref:Diguanylate cyclase (GGDEF)-like protein/PAS domain S-box-containing protein n=2 Tax=Rhizobium/Agrobacterium group TaxID=227290 RepID=A0AAE2T044_RHILE|nr:diguanylate cyclase (GGDEF)-like protein/PAS domain S-box-containing protein [Rhizobium leguminosarum]MDF9821851.1 diguanylate cyclase (GGDEF)-like protein/PAS domain S-box-containing protein [Rhizobium leguminosarum]